MTDTPTAHSKSEYKRMTAMGANVNPPAARDAAPPVLGPLRTLSDEQLDEIAEMLVLSYVPERSDMRYAIRELLTELDAQRAEVARLTAEQARMRTDPCTVAPYNSQVCVRGTQCCDARHEAERVTRPTEGLS